jgi:hypothetical protein
MERKLAQVLGLHNEDVEGVELHLTHFASILTHFGLGLPRSKSWSVSAIGPQPRSGERRLQRASVVLETALAVTGDSAASNFSEYAKHVFILLSLGDLLFAWHAPKSAKKRPQLELAIPG